MNYVAAGLMLLAAIVAFASNHLVYGRIAGGIGNLAAAALALLAVIVILRAVSRRS